MNSSKDVEIKLINFIPGIGDRSETILGTTYISRNQLGEIYATFEIFKDNKVKNLNLKIQHEGFNDYHRDVVEKGDISDRVLNICENSVEELKDIIRKNYNDSKFSNKDKIEGTIKGKFGSNNNLEFESSINFY